MNIQSDSTKVTFTQVYQDVKEGLSALGEALKVGAEHVYQVLITQQYVKSISLLILNVVLISVTIFVAINTPKWYKKGMKQDQYEPWGMLYIIPSILAIASIVTLCSTVQVIVTGFVNPEYGAMKEIMEFVK